MPYDGNMISILDFCWSDLQPVLEHPASRLFVLIERMGIDVQRGGGLAVAQEARHRGYVRSVCNEQAGVGVPQGVDVQILRQTVFFQDQLKPPGESRGRHRKAAALAAEQEVLIL